MADGKRPGGLTALAVLNFVFGGLGALLMLGLVALLSVTSSAVHAAGGELTSAPGAGLVYLALLLGGINVILLIASGVGYIGQKKFLGRTLGTVYAILSLAGSVISLAGLHTGFGIGTIIGLIYPVLTLVLLNTTFKDDLVN